MSNELYEHKRSDTVKWVLTLIAFIVVGIMLAGIICGWFEKKETEEEQAGAPAYSFIVGNGEGNRMSLTSVRNNAVTGEIITITATVEPDNEAENTGVDWTATWKNAGSVWASGKSVSDYVTLTPGGEDYAASKSVTLENLQPFGEQIIIKATARDDPEITATCTADYAQKPVNFSLSFGEVSCNFGGDTDVTLEINANAETAPGGAADAQFTKSEVYSLSQEFTVSYELTGKKFMSYTASGYGVEGWYIFGTWLPSPDFKDEYADLSGYSVADNGLYFGIKYLSDNLQLHTVGGGMGGLNSSPASEHVPSEFIQRFTHAGESLIPEGNALTYTYGSDLEMLDLKVTLTGEYATYTYETTFVIAGYTNTSTLTGMDVSEPAVVF